MIEALSINQIDVSKQALIDEPNAAFLSYILDSDTFGEAITIPNGINPKMLVFDFGAGTCDISILEIGVNRKGVYSKNLSISKFENWEEMILIDILLIISFIRNCWFRMD